MDKFNCYQFKSIALFLEKENIKALRPLKNEGIDKALLLVYIRFKNRDAVECEVGVLEWQKAMWTEVDSSKGLCFWCRAHAIDLLDARIGALERVYRSNK